MSMPGFTAEAALFNTGTGYRVVARGPGLTFLVVPQAEFALGVRRQADFSTRLSDNPTIGKPQDRQGVLIDSTVNVDSFGSLGGVSRIGAPPWHCGPCVKQPGNSYGQQSCTMTLPLNTVCTDGKGNSWNCIKATEIRYSNPCS